MQSSTVTSANRQIARAAGVVMVTFVFSKLISLFSTILLARTFGASSVLDAFNAANRFSDTLFTLVAGGALASAFVPTFTALITRQERTSAWQLASAMINLVLLVLIVAGTLGAIFAPWVVQTLLAPKFSPEQQILTAHLLRIQLLSAIIFGISGLLMGILNAHQIFLYPALAPAMYPLGVIFGVLVLSPRMGIDGAAWGVVIGAGLHLLVQVPGVLRLPERAYRLMLGLQLPEVRRVLLLMGPRLVGVAVVQFNFWVNTNLASGHPEGSVSAILLGFGLMMMPQAAIAQSIAIASLPTFSAQVARGKPEDMRASLAAALRVVLLLSMPAAVGLILLRRPIVAFLYEDGLTFTAAMTELVAWALLWYAAGLVGHCVVEIVSRAFYALHDTRTPVAVGVAAMSLNVVFSLAFSALFTRAGLPPHGGLALANSLATALEMVALLVLMRRRLNGLELPNLARALGASALAASAMSLGVWTWQQFASTLPAGLLSADGMQAAVAILAGGLIYVTLLIVLRVKEIQAGWGWLSRRFLGK
jgi:putative peptidoglycan lipid II flippase